jgi:hypothetical protein
MKIRIFLLRFMKHLYSFAALAGLLFGVQAFGQSVVYNFSDGTSDGWASSGFSGSPASSVSNILGNNYIFAPLGSSFQVANVSSGDPTSAFYQAMQAAGANPSGYDISYNYYFDTSTFGPTPPSFLQLGTFVNGGNGQYFQDFSTPNEVQFNGSQLASGQVFQGTVTFNMGTAGFALNPTNNFYRLGLIENGNNGASASAIGVYLTDISITAVPEPSVLCLFGLGATGLWMRRRLNRRAAV